MRAPINMIPQADLELLTQAVDGELSQRDHRHLRRLLVASPEARNLHDRLLADRERLRRLPAIVPPPDLAGRVIARVSHAVPAALTIRTAPPPARPSLLRRAWVPITFAASLFAALGGVSYWFAARPGAPSDAESYALNPRAPKAGPADPVPSGEPEWRNSLPPETDPLPSRPNEPTEKVAVVPAPVQSAPDPSRLAAKRPEVVAPPRPVVRDDALTSPLIGRIAPFDVVQARLPFLASLGDLKEKAETREALARELQKDQAYRIDLFAHDANRGLEMLLNAVRAHGIAIHVDAVARDRHKPKKLPAPATLYVLYLECLSAAEMRDVLGKLAAHDARQPVRAFDSLHLAPVQVADQRELKDLLGVDLGFGKRLDSQAMSKGIAAGTADQVARSVVGGTAGKAPERPAIVLAFAPAAARVKPSASKEVQHFLSKRGEHRPSSLPFMVVVRAAN